MGAGHRAMAQVPLRAHESRCGYGEGHEMVGPIVRAACGTGSSTQRPQEHEMSNVATEAQLAWPWICAFNHEITKSFNHDSPGASQGCERRGRRDQLAVARSLCPTSSHHFFAGYLHWFTRAGEVQPLDFLALGRSTFEAGKV